MHKLTPEQLATLDTPENLAIAADRMIDWAFAELHAILRGQECDIDRWDQRDVNDTAGDR